MLLRLGTVQSGWVDVVNREGTVLRHRGIVNEGLLVLLLKLGLGLMQGLFLLLFLLLLHIVLMLLRLLLLLQLLLQLLLPIVQVSGMHPFIFDH